MPEVKLCLCLSHGCRKAYETNGIGHSLPSRTLKKHMDDDRVAQLTNQLATTRLDGLRASLEDAQRQTIHVQEADAAASLASGQSYPLSPVVNSRAQKLLEHIEGVDARLTRANKNINSLGQPGSPTSESTSVHDAETALKALHAIEQSVHAENDKLRLIREGCNGDEGLLVVHQEVRVRAGELLERIRARRSIWKDALEAATFLQERKAATGAHYDTAHHFSNTFRRSKPLIQISILMVVGCSIVLNLPRRGSTWLFDLARLIIQTTVLKAISLVNDLAASFLGSHPFLPSIESLPYFQSILSDFPRDIRTATNQFNLDGKKTIYATCLKCHEVYAPTFHNTLPVYPRACSRKKYGRSACKGVLVRKRKVDGQTVYTPIKPYIAYDFKDWLASLLSRQGYEEMMDSAWDRMNDHSPNGLLGDIFQGSVIRNFKGPDGTTHFSISGGPDAGRYVFALSVDFFNPLGNKIAGKKVSIGAITISCLNLPISVRNKPENIFLAGIIPGPKEPSNSQINPYLRPLIDAFLELWKGVRFSQTSKYNLGRLILAALVAIVCDLPAARKVGGFSSHSHRYFCSICWCNRTNHTYNDISVDSWIRRTNEECREHAEAWRSASSKGAAQKLFDKSGLRWSELLRLPYYEPAKFLVIDPMHNLFLGLIKEHFQGILGYVPPGQQRGSSDPWAQSLRIHIPLSPLNPLPTCAKEQSSLRKLVSWLEAPLEFDRGDSTTSKHLVKRWASIHLASLIYVAKGIGCISPTVDTKGKDTSLPNPTKPLTKLQVAERLLDWRLQQAEATDDSSGPEGSGNGVNHPPMQHGSVFTTKEMEALWNDIESLVKPSWVQSPPSTLGMPSCGKLKSDQWRIIGSLYLPVTLIRLWGNPSSEGARLRRRQEILQLTMHLLSAIVVASSQVTSPQHAEAYMSHMIEYRKQLKILFPDYQCHPNHHIALHVPEYLLMYGPVHGWWAYPYERVIGMLQRFSTNYKEGEYEETISRSWHRLANLRAFFSKATCPQPILACYDMFMSLVPSHIRSPLDVHSHPSLDDDDNDSLNPRVTRKQENLSGTLRAAFQDVLGPGIQIPSHAAFSSQVTYDNQFFTSSRRHKGNSGVLRKRSAVPFCIDHIVEFPESQNSRLNGKWLIGRSIKPVALRHDPYSDFPHLRAKLWGADLESSVEICRLDDIESHFAQHSVFWEGKNTTVVVSLSRQLVL